MLEAAWFTAYNKIFYVSAVNAKASQLGCGDLLVSLSYCVQLRKYKFVSKCGFTNIIST